MDVALPPSSTRSLSQQLFECPAFVLPVLSPVLKDAIVVLLAVVGGVAVRASCSSAPVHVEAPPSAQIQCLQAWTTSLCVLVAAALLAWVVKERGAVLASHLAHQGEEYAAHLELQPSKASPLARPRPVWDPLEFAADEEMECEKRWRPLEIKHGHLGLLANVGLVGVRQCSSSSSSSTSTEMGSTCSTESPEMSSECAESCLSESASEHGDMARSDKAEPTSNANVNETMQTSQAAVSESAAPAPKQDEFGGAEAEPSAPKIDPGILPATVRSGCLWSELCEEEVSPPSNREEEVSAQAPAPQHFSTPAVALSAPADAQTPARKIDGEKPADFRWADDVEEEPKKPPMPRDVGPPVLHLAAELDRVVSQPGPSYTHPRLIGHFSDSAFSSHARRMRRPDRDLPLQEILQTLGSMSPCHSLIVRKIKKLGFKSASSLRMHFERFGPVDHIYVTHSHLQDRNRPASLGFVVMGTEEGRRLALAAGPEQGVRDCVISVRPFEPKEEHGQEE